MTAYPGFPRITSDPACAGGQPCIRDLGLTLTHLLGLLAEDPSAALARSRHPGLTDQDLPQALAFAARFLSVPPLTDEDALRQQRRSAIAKASAYLRHLGPGPIAELRRNRGDPARLPVFLKCCQSIRIDASASWAWALILAGMARLRHGTKPAAGSALAKAGLAETRLQRLLDADRAHIAAELRAVVAFLASKGQQCSWYDLGELVLSVAGHDPCHDQVRRKIAGDFFKKSKSPSTKP